jgi:hypothetical protein
MVQPINELKSQHDHKLNWFFIYDARAAPVIVKGSRVMLEGGQCTIFPARCGSLVPIACLF